mmetsp:Transcript_1848/g.2930  ORF Transcript_1848/g.2930 Transcript_1848/m.2930 type:complete len:207 (+) Transcript_1848:117-737(+)|eukprot:CAMPEP_0185029598 /NCGR_PEP_ID=MMETSP1103-20130426/15996_1 /TAXON_ID=36769 /ORGANISM="Paraphysomonas bandaiensis, Strain Caron Lab Isolate" /LENGTH=206 /DNA_ID=CAMNT_0027564403 /DNA_START=57 /DNA_END=677 /DNA_ORIENTATION=+
MIRTSYHITQQHNLFLALNSNDSSCKNYLAACEQVDADQIITARDVRDEYGGLTLLHEAARLGYVVAVQQLLSLGHAIDAIDTSASLVTPLMEAISADHIDVAGILVRSGADLSKRDVRGENCFHYAARSGSRMIKCLVKHSNLSKESIQALMCVTSVVLKFPEDVAVNSLAKEVLLNLRERGYHPTYSKTKTKNEKKSSRKKRAD